MAIKDIHNYGRSVKARLLNVAHNEGLQYQLLLTRYFQERLLYRLSVSSYRNSFLLKGGALLYAHERFAARPTLDIDFMGQFIDNDKQNIKQAMSEICSIPYMEDGVIFIIDTIRTEDIALEKRYPGIRLTLTATLDSVRQDVSMDIGFGDIVTPSPVELDYPNLLEGFSMTSILAYSIETVIAEKFQTLIDRAEANSRMKDFYDLYTLLKSNKYDCDILREAVKATFNNRNTAYQQNHPFFSAEFVSNTNLTIRWNAFIKKLQPTNSLTFSEVVKFLQEKLSDYWKDYGRNI